MRRLLAIATVLGASAAAVVLSGATEESQGKKYWVQFDNAFGIVEGGDFRIGAVRAGTTGDMRLTGSEPYKVEVEVEVTEPGFDSLREDASCRVANQSLIGEYYVDCELGVAGTEIEDGGTVPVEQTSSAIPPDLIANVMRRPFRERWRLILSELGVGLAGRPDELNEVIRRAHPALREITETTAILRRQNRTLRDFIVDADRVSAAVEPKKEEVARWAQEASETAEIQASRADELAAQWNRLPRFLGELRPTLAQLESTADEQIPFLRRLRSAAPDLHRFLVALEDFAPASLRSTRALGDAAVTGRRAVREAREEVAELRDLASKAPRLAKPLRQFLQTIDDRGRSVEGDPLHLQTSPPAPDKTAAQPGKGFTGMEALMNYIYYQTLGINGFDQVSHFLRIVLLQTDCSPYSNDPDERLVRLCSTGVGPYQPCIRARVPGLAEGPNRLVHNGRDLCDYRSALSGEGASAEGQGDPPAAQDSSNRRRGPGEPQAQPRPGERDISKPMVELPPQIQRLLDGIANPEKLEAAPSVPGDAAPNDAVAPDTLLDYLLAP